MGRRTVEVNPGDIFTIPLFLPSNWGDDYDVDYSKYKFHTDDIYGFGRLIEIQTGNVDLVEVFHYAGQIPKSPEIILNSGRMFAPEHVGHPYTGRGRWQAVFNDPRYDMWQDSDYENISFLSSAGHMWKGKETIPISARRYDELKRAGVPDWVMNSRIDLEKRIRSTLEAWGIALHYEQVVKERKHEFPKPRDPDKKLKETIAPFHWISGQGKYTLSLDAGLLHGDLFTKHDMLGNGYDWEKIASAFMEKQGMDVYRKFRFDCEADTFSLTSSSKKLLKEFSLSFHEFVMDTEVFEEFLRGLSGRFA